jgi:hypothetical protein
MWPSSPWFIVISGGRKLVLRASKLSADGFGNPPNAGIEGFGTERSVVVAGQGPFCLFAMPTLPRQGPSDESSQEFRYGSQKFEPPSCGVEMVAGGEARLPYLHAKPLAGRRHRSRPARRRSRAREEREPLPDGAGPAPWRQAVGTRVTIMALRECGPFVEGIAARWLLLLDVADLPDHRRIDALLDEPSAQSSAAIVNFTMCAPAACNAVFHMTAL